MREPWGYQLRLKGTLTVRDGTEKTTTPACAKERIFDHWRAQAERALTLLTDQRPAVQPEVRRGWWRRLFR